MSMGRTNAGSGLAGAGLLLLALLIPSCSSRPASVQPVQGQVQVDGVPAAHAMVTLHPLNAPAEAVQPSGVTDEQGVFRLTTYRENDGAPEGEYAVSVTWFRSVPSRDAERFRTLNFLPARYADPQTSQLKVTVTRGNSELPPLQLKKR